MIQKSLPQDFNKTLMISDAIGDKSESQSKFVLARSRVVPWKHWGFHLLPSSP
jgi:hypothetical protein